MGKRQCAAQHLWWSEHGSCSGCRSILGNYASTGQEYFFASLTASVTDGVIEYLVVAVMPVDRHDGRVRERLTMAIELMAQTRCDADGRPAATALDPMGVNDREAKRENG